LKALSRYDELLHEMRPDVIGGTLAIADDGTFYQTIAFTDEQSARRGEQQEVPAEVAQDMAAAMGDVTYLDLHEPWFTSR
jgi:hypothetical protein